jgi:hypothetical protein
MGVTLWLDTEREETIELGGTFACYRAFAEMAKVAGGWDAWVSDYPDLAGVLDQCETQEDADPLWLADVKRQARTFLEAHEQRLSEDARNLLDNLAQSIP